MASSTSSRPTQTPRLPELFGRETTLLGWQGISLLMPKEWNLAAFGGDFSKGNLRVADDEGVRLELVWERAKNIPNVARSVELLLQNIGREAKKKKTAFEVQENAKVVSRTRREHADKEQITDFGWIGDKEEPLAHGWGAAWHCEVSNRVVVAHVLGRGSESPDKTRRLAAEVLNSCASHGQGGWQTWSVFDLQFEMPEEFHLIGAKLQTGRLEFDFERVRPHDPLSFMSVKSWGARTERLGLRRVSAANVLLEDQSLEDWTRHVASAMFKPYRFNAPRAARVLEREGYTLEGGLRDWRRAFKIWLFSRLLRRKTHPPRLDVWQDKGANKIFVCLADLENQNLRVRDDVIESIVTQ